MVGVTQDLQRSHSPTPGEAETGPNTTPKNAQLVQSNV